MINQVIITGILANTIELKYDEQNEPYTILSLATRIGIEDENDMIIIEYMINGDKAVDLSKQPVSVRKSIVSLQGFLVQNGLGQEFIVREMSLMTHSEAIN